MERKKYENKPGKRFENTVRESNNRAKMMTTFDKESPGYANRTAKKRGTDKVTASLPPTPSKKAAVIKTIMNSPRTILAFLKYFYL